MIDKTEILEKKSISRLLLSKIKILEVMGWIKYIPKEHSPIVLTKL